MCVHNIILKIFSLFAIGAAIFIVFACKDSGTRPDEKEFVLPDTNVSFIQHVQPMLEAKCGFEGGCHSPQDVTSPLLYIELINRVELTNHIHSQTGKKLVDIPFDQANPQLAPLYLILKEGYPQAPQDRMPPYPRTVLNKNQLDGILVWIKEGAKD